MGSTSIFSLPAQEMLELFQPRQAQQRAQAISGWLKLAQSTIGHKLHCISLEEKKLPIRASSSRSCMAKRPEVEGTPQHVTAPTSEGGRGLIRSVWVPLLASSPQLQCVCPQPCYSRFGAQCREKAEPRFKLCRSHSD
jgi:hypothetical protein